MFFKKIRFVNFRNFTNLEIKLSNGINFLIGDNGQGKTNFLEAISLFTLGDSFRYCDNVNLIHKNANEASLRAEIEKNELTNELKLQISKSRRYFQINEKKTLGVELKKKFHAVVFSPESLSAIKESSDLRRNLIDELLSSLSSQNVELIYQFRKALKTRNRILKDYVENRQSLAITEQLLDSLNPSYFKLAIELTRQRLKSFSIILPELNNAMRKISNNNAVEISVEYIISGGKVGFDSTENIHNILHKRAEELHSAELSAGTTLIGPHKHEILFLYDQKDSRFYCSQGQQRAIILSFKMAQVVYYKQVHGEYPVLLLDDVLSELDATKRSALISFLHEIKTQTFISSTDLTLPENFHLSETNIITLREGKLLEKS